MPDIIFLVIIIPGTGLTGSEGRVEIVLSSPAVSSELPNCSAAVSPLLSSNLFPRQLPLGSKSRAASGGEPKHSASSRGQPDTLGAVHWITMDHGDDGDGVDGVDGDI